MRWLLLPVGLALAAFAGWLLLAPADPLREPPAVSAGPETSAPAARSRPGAAAAPPARGHIDEASQRELDALLQREGLEP